MFPAQRPGFALLLMRVALAVLLLGTVGRQFMHFGSPWFLLAPVVVALALTLGFITPVASALCVVLELTIWATSAGAIQALHACAILDAIALAMLGPGAYSLDARLFGRRQVVIRSKRDSQDR
jgi:hypothetical protein